MFYSQTGEDQFIIENQLCPRQGTFVDVGAGDPVALSNTYAFEQLGWKGLAIDPHPIYRARWSSHRTCPLEECAIKAHDGTTMLHQGVDPTLSTTLLPHHHNSAIQVPCFRLERLLAKHHIRKIDLLSIDVEGAELEVWESMCWELHQPGLVIIEHNTAGRESNARGILEHFEKLPYRPVFLSAFNFVFRLE